MAMLLLLLLLMMMMIFLNKRRINFIGSFESLFIGVFPSARGKGQIDLIRENLGCFRCVDSLKNQPSRA